VVLRHGVTDGTTRLGIWFKYENKFGFIKRNGLNARPYQMPSRWRMELHLLWAIFD
jgi:hypothetical protein